MDEYFQAAKRAYEKTLEASKAHGRQEQGNVIKVDWLYVLIVCLIIAFIIGMAFCINEAIKKDKEWETFKVSHHCKLASKIDGQLVNTFGADGKVGVAITDSQEGWLCDDGITYVK